MRLKAKANGSTSGIDADEVRRALALLADPAHGCELRGLPSGRSVVRAAKNLDALLDVADMLSSDLGIYYALNPVPADLGRPTRVGDVLRRWNVLVDVDAVKPEASKNDPSTDAEHEAARQVALAVRQHLGTLGWPAPLLIDSGNGWHLVYRVDLPNDEHARVLLRTILHGLAARFDGPGGTIDRAVHNASRIARLPGTMARKGTPSPERPWRWCRIVERPPALVPVGSAELLAAAAGPGELPLTPAGKGVANSDTLTGDKPSGLKARATGSNPAAAWAQSALQREVGKVCTARAPGRNNQLNASAYALGQIVAGGGLGRDEVHAALCAAAEACGLDNDSGCGLAGIKATVDSGLDAGAREPRGAPEPVGKTPGRAQAPAPARPLDGPVIVRASAIAPRRVEWLWPGIIPLGKLTTFAGQGGLGKTFVLLDIAARVSTGDEWPDAAGECAEPGQVLFVSGEDDPDDTLVPRLYELGADKSRVAFLRSEALDHFQLSDLGLLTRALAEMGGMEPPVRLVAIDPPTAYLAGIDDHKNAELRTVLSPLKELASRHRVAIIFNTHVNKGQGGKVEAVTRVMGSVAWVNAVRSAHIFAKDPDDPERRLFVPMKNNLGPERHGLAYRIAPTRDLAKVEWLGPVTTTADEAVARSEPKVKRRVQAASDWLIERFRERREWPSDELFRTAKEQGISKNAIYEAKETLALPKARKVSHESGDVCWVWWVPPDWPQLAREGASTKTPGDLGELNEIAF